MMRTNVPKHSNASKWSSHCVEMDVKQEDEIGRYRCERENALFIRCGDKDHVEWPNLCL